MTELTNSGVYKLTESGIQGMTDKNEIIYLQKGNTLYGYTLDGIFHGLVVKGSRGLGRANKGTNISLMASELQEHSKLIED